MFFSRKNLRAWCTLLTAAVLNACALYSRVEIPVDAEWLTKLGAGAMVYRGIEYPIMKPRTSEDTLIFSRVNMRMSDGTLGYLTAEDMRPSDRGYHLHVDSLYELLTDQPVLRVPQGAIAKAKTDVLNPAAIFGNGVLVFLGYIGIVVVIWLATSSEISLFQF